jgi:hypothetical protein
MIFTRSWICKYCVEASGFLIYALFFHPLLKKLIKKNICIFSMQKVILHFKKCDILVLRLFFYLFYLSRLERPYAS